MSTESATAQLVDGRYRLGEVLGTGGSAVVRRAHDERLRRDVAIKLFHPGTADQERQNGELALMASLAHPALLRMYDGGEITDINGAQSTYLVMEYVPGPTLNRALDAGAMSKAEVAAIGAALASALAYLHGRGVVHRDVKPANVLLPPDEGTAKLGDFGVARILDSARVTATGMTVGTANYLSPEQALGQAVGPASDMYSLGLALLEALTGQITYGGVGVAAAVARLNRPPVIPVTLGRAWTALLTAMLDNDPAARPDAAWVRRELAGVETGAMPAVAAHAVTSTMAAAPAGRTAVLPARHRAAESWPDSYLVDESPRRRGRMRPITIFVLMAASAAAIVIGALAASMSSGASNSPAAPLNQSKTTTPSTAQSNSAQSSAAAARPGNTKAATIAAPVAVHSAASRPAPAPKRPITTVGHGHGKAKQRKKHGGH